jgi:hypothetical protein
MSAEEMPRGRGEMKSPELPNADTFERDVAQTVACQ